MLYACSTAVPVCDTDTPISKALLGHVLHAGLSLLTVTLMFHFHTDVPKCG
jgi:hypothetical protein